MRMSEWLIDVPLPSLDDQLRFWGKTDRTSDGCWIWIGALYDKRYGRFTIRGRSYSAHRVSYRMFVGDPGTMLVCHECNNTKCVNPAHLFLGTNSDNQIHRSDCGRFDQRGELNPNAKLTEDEVLVILQELKRLDRAEVAKLHRVSIGTIHQIARGQTWRHLHGFGIF